MSDPVNQKSDRKSRQTRPYRSAKRAEAAAATRARIREAAARLFTEKGYTGTRMKEVAALAGVGERTLYDAFPTKAALFGHTLGVAIAGDEEPVAVPERPETLAIRDETDPERAIGRTVGQITELLERAGDLIMVTVEAAGADPDMRASADAGAEATYGVHLALTTALEERGALRPGLDARTAADTLYALASPHMHQLLRRHRGWTSDAYRTWLRRVLVAELLGSN
ncbi:helix-turn-helix transcriptional regulator [Streptomyces sp. MBT65]|uniref:TetR/AcrR family transcriptional regulator n=1 Tax=Streptomyces sp. MBT65 TaxID=1488395 RepID=UPI0019090813|nr:TetR/AcrR family transcriptional regulator [Streptomyces sp. MBT65]MBK3575742.1 helix-turn-helix transcriptional regulator [Streptomyces sp. MBT65]